AGVRTLLAIGSGFIGVGLKRAQLQNAPNKQGSILIHIKNQGDDGDACSHQGARYPKLRGRSEKVGPAARTTGGGRHSVDAIFGDATRPHGCCAWLASASRCPPASASAGRSSV